MQLSIADILVDKNILKERLLRKRFSLLCIQFNKLLQITYNITIHCNILFFLHFILINFQTNTNTKVMQTIICFYQ